MNEKSGRVSGSLGHFSKTDIRFWQDRLFLETYRGNGQLFLKRLTGRRESNMKDAGNVIAVLGVILLERIIDRDIKQLRCFPIT